MFNYNAISLSGPELSSLYNKYKMSSIGQQNAHDALARTLAQSSNYLPPKTLAVPALTTLRPTEFAVVPIDKEPIFNRVQAKEHLIKASDKILDEIELYGLVITNDLFKISRNQQIISKTDFSSDFIEFRKKIFKVIESTGDQSIDIVKKMKDEFMAMIKLVNDNMRSKLRRINVSSNSIEESFKSLKEMMTIGVERVEKKINNTSEEIDAMYPYLIPASLRKEIEAAKKVYDYERRKERRKNIRVFKKYLAYLNERINNSLLEFKGIKEQRMKIIDERKKQDRLDTNAREQDKQRRLKELQLKLDQEKLLHYAEQDIKIQFINDTVTPYDEMIKIPPAANNIVERQKLREDHLARIEQINLEEKQENEIKRNNVAALNKKKMKSPPKSIPKKNEYRQMSAPDEHL